MSPAMLLNNILDGIADGNKDAFLAANEYGRAMAFGTANNVGLIEPYDEFLRQTQTDESAVVCIRAALRQSIRTTIPDSERGIKPLSSFRSDEASGYLE